MPSLVVAALWRSRLGLRGAALGSAALCAALGCSACGAPPGPSPVSNSGSGTGGTAASSGGSSASSVMLAMNGGKYSLAFGSTYLEVDPMSGARITALRVGGATGMDLITNAALNAGTANADNWGSVFWPSPQSSWGWPPTGPGTIEAINTLAYTAAMDASSLTLTSGVAAKPTVSVIKKFSADLAKEAVIIDYTVTNGGTAMVNVAPWEITRMGAGSITFYMPGTGAPKAGDTFALPPTMSAAGATWFQHTGSATQYKLLADGSGGWLASAIGNLLLVKTFTDIPDGAGAAGEAEVEIYSSPLYVEVEQQGAVQMLAPGAALHWTVRWYARKLAAPAAVGSADLVTYVQNLIK